ncbi:WAS/WASL-interacting protein family member 3-like [Schistocerca serialis cubense]|uniref:WAS/WASL-interacting protein family member 3-like n=1 Tax=Schistocerca serialis cubense TaxID=2023355 RepID=UPI00214EB550|nr:WAS/WASL-interacting protein family member 3-like [Schistocerca serialis cubense]
MPNQPAQQPIPTLPSSPPNCLPASPQCDGHHPHMPPAPPSLLPLPLLTHEGIKSNRGGDNNVFAMFPSAKEWDLFVGLKKQVHMSVLQEPIIVVLPLRLQGGVGGVVIVNGGVGCAGAVCAGVVSTGSAGGAGDGQGTRFHSSADDGRQAGSRRCLRRHDGSPRRCSLPASAGRRCINVVAGAAASAEGRRTEPSRAALCVFSSRPGSARPAQVSPEPPAVCEISYVNPSRAHPITKGSRVQIELGAAARIFSLWQRRHAPVPPPRPPATPPPLPGGPGPLLSLQAGEGRTRTTRHPPTPSPPPPPTPPASVHAASCHSGYKSKILSKNEGYIT